MGKQLHIGIIGDFDPSTYTHIATNQAIIHAADALGITTTVRWLETTTLASLDTAAPSSQGRVTLTEFDALWCAPGSPYRSMQGALNGIRFARQSRVPFLGTCAGFQHVVIEYARHVLGFVNAQHAEYDPTASHLFVNQLACSLVGKTMTIQINSTSRAYGYYGRKEVREQYYCRFGLNPIYRQLLEDGGLHIAGYDTEGEARILELPDHPFFLATLFLPQLNSATEQPHPLILALCRSALEWQERRSMAEQLVGRKAAQAL